MSTKDLERKLQRNTTRRRKLTSDLNDLRVEMEELLREATAQPGRPTIGYLADLAGIRRETVYTAVNRAHARRGRDVE